MLVGNILAVSWDEVIKTALPLRRGRRVPLRLPPRFLAISMDHGDAEATGLNFRLWDFLFYASFGFVVTSSVAIAGVLLVFCYLIVPSVAAMLYADSIGTRLAIGWTGDGGVGVGVYLSLCWTCPPAQPSSARRPGIGRQAPGRSSPAQRLVNGAGGRPGTPIPRRPWSIDQAGTVTASWCGKAERQGRENSRKAISGSPSYRPRAGPEGRSYDERR